MVHEPQLLFLDEPSTGLDPQSRANLWDHLARMREQHDTTIFLTTHYLDEADAMAERVVVIDHGRVIADGTPEVAQGPDGRRLGPSASASPMPRSRARRRDREPGRRRPPEVE